MTEFVLVGDIGGTNARFALAQSNGNNSPKLVSERQFVNGEFIDFSDVLATYLKQISVTPENALFAVAGPVSIDGSIKLVNRDWPDIHPEKLSVIHGISSVTLVNDFAAMARAIPELTDDCFEVILAGTPVSGAPILVTGPGTGFGMGTLVPMAKRYLVITGEGGHAAYAPRTQKEHDIAERIRSKHGYVSTESIVAGFWGQNLLDEMSDMNGVARRRLSPNDIVELAGAGDSICVEHCTLRALAKAKQNSLI